MMPSKRWRVASFSLALAALVAGAVLVASAGSGAVGRDRSRDPNRVANLTAARVDEWRGDLCLLGRGFEVTSQDVEELRTLIQPPPPWDQAVELAADMSLLYFFRHGTLKQIPMLKRREAYALLVRKEFSRLKTPGRVADELRNLRAAASKKLGAQQLRCAPPHYQARKQRAKEGR